MTVFLYFASFERFDRLTIVGMVPLAPATLALFFKIGVRNVRHEFLTPITRRCMSTARKKLMHRESLHDDHQTLT